MAGNIVERMIEALFCAIESQTHEYAAPSRIYRDAGNLRDVLNAGQVDMLEAMTATLAALREPTDSMLRGAEHILVLLPVGKPVKPTMAPIELWHAMIDMALPEAAAINARE